MDFQPTEHHRQLVKMARDLAERHFAPRAFTWEARGDYPHEYLKILADHGLTGITLPERWGGQGGRLLDAVLVIETIAQVCPNAADCVQATNFGAIVQLARLGSDALRERYLRPLLRGDGLITLAMSEPDAGSAVTELGSRARWDGDHVVLDGRKVFNSNGPHSTRWIVWARFGDRTRDIGAVLVERGTPGFELHEHRFMSGEPYGMLFFDACRVPRDNVLAAEDGFKRLIATFNVERLGNAARALGLGQLAFDIAVAHAKERRQFGKRLCDFQGLQWKFADMKLRLEAARLLLYRAAADADAGVPSALDTSLAKLACNEAGFWVANEALQILGGLGYSDESRVNYLFRRTRGWQIAGGSLEQMRNRIAAEVFGESFSQR
jgi:alkylation response protein AidB-like acyl-CoA dehydrogenase